MSYGNPMALILHVADLETSEDAEEIRDTILTHEPDAKVEIDVDQKIITIEAKASEETFKQAVTAAGFEISGY